MGRFRRRSSLTGDAFVTQCSRLKSSERDYRIVGLKVDDDFGRRIYSREMDPNAVKSTLSNLAFGNVMAAAARDYQKELLTQEKAPASTSIDQEVDLDELMDDPELEKLHADRIAALKNAPFFIAKLAIKLLPCDILFRNGIGTDRLVGFQDLGGKDDFTTKTLEALLIRKGIINGIKGDGEDEDDDYHENKRRTVRSSVGINSDSN
ncbi:thioredoxin domain-containing protein PLP3A-like isoform X1 [Actinidia eriantha]|uniref:thioredoxin domain-containing protein PLP3A-like isoform X1 n=1 Tax=Actinidia eriantha TaxID=165200 RepID=UPI00258DB142|nr:thioredoxin domain-containing protein PLP3A-like isoform X1 [Actinidia eriantha]